MRNEPEVVQAHRSFLLYRDVATGQFLLLLSLLLWMVIDEIVPAPSLSLWSVVIPVCMFVLLFIAARQCRDRMVTNAVAVSLGASREAESS